MLVLLLLVVAVVGAVGYKVVKKQNTDKNHATPTASLVTPTTHPVTTATTNTFITSSPVELAQIAKISKFRSCEGHDSSGYDIEGMAETNRSMKHYILPIDALAGSIGKVKEFAPFDGTIVTLFPESSTHGNQMWIQSTADPSWVIILFHLDTNLTVGTTVKSGDPVGYASLGLKENSFDVALMKTDETTLSKTKEVFNKKTVTGNFSENDRANPPKFTYDSFLLHMSPSVTTSYAARGLTADTSIISKAARDAQPCVFGGPIDPANWVMLN